MKYANRAGFFMNSAVGYKSFVPAELPHHQFNMMTNFRACCHLRIENLVDWTA